MEIYSKNGECFFIDSDRLAKMRFRKVMMEEHPEYHLQAWDAGWYQVKLILKEYLKEDLKEFQKVYKMLEQKITERVYELGFLRR